MIERLLRVMLERPSVVLVLVTSSALFGALALRDLPRDVFPDLSAPVFNVIVQNAAMGAEELERAVVVPLEAALGGVPQVRRMRSVAQLGVAQITVELDPDADYHQSRQLVTERVNQAAGQLPAGSEPPLVSSLSGRLNEVFELTLETESSAVDLMTLRDLAEYEVKNRLLAVPGVAAVERLGGYLRQLQVQIDPERMAARGIALDEVLHAVRGANASAAAGFIVQGTTEWSVRAMARARDAADVRGTVVALRGTVPVVLGDIADVREAPAVRRGIAHRLRGEVVSCRVVKQFGADTVGVAAGIRAALEEVQRGLPPGVVIRTVYDQSVLIGSALRGVGRAVLLGAVFVAVVLVLLLGNVRAAAIVILTIPLSIALAGALLRAAGVGINTMTLGGFAIAVGLLVDAAIIVVENVLHRVVRSGGATPRAAALAAAADVSRPITFATLIVIAVFVPLLVMGGIEGRMYRPLALAVMGTVSAALILAVTIVPLAAVWALRPRDTGADDVWIIAAVKRRYAPMLDWCLRRAGRVRLMTLLLTVPALLLAFVVGSDFMPRLDEGALLLQTQLPAEASLDEVDRLNHRVEDVLRTFPEVEDVVRRTGRAERTEDPMPHTLSDVLVVLRPERRRNLDDLSAAMRAALDGVPGVTVSFTTPLGMRIDEGLGGTPADLSVRVFGPDLDILQRLAERVRTEIHDVRGIVDLRVEAAAALPQVRVVVDRDAAARVGLTPSDIVDAARIGLVGEVVSEIWKGQRSFDVLLRLQDHRRADLTGIRTLLIDGHDGTRVPLGQVATIEEGFGPAAIRREANSRRIAVETGVAGRDLGSTAAQVRERVHTIDLPAGYFLHVGGRIDSQERSMRSLWVSIAVALVLVFVLLALALGSAAESLVILATLPDAFVGGIAALLLSGGSWNVSSLVGLIGLFGIAVQNGLVLITQTQALVADGWPFAVALREASLGRVRPKLLTASTAILGLLPLLVLPLHGTEIERPLAVVMIGGLVTSTLFTLFALPTFYLFVSQLRERGKRGDAGIP